MQSRTVAVNGGQLRVVEWGKGPDAVLLHGFALDHRLWLDCADRLRERRCIAVDLRGSGGSSPVPASGMTIEQHTEDLVQLLAALDVDRADVAGFSMGGFVLLALWERAPEVMRSVALIDSRANADSPAARTERDRLAVLALEAGRGALFEALRPKLAAADAPPHVLGRLRTMLEETPYETLVAALAAMRDRPDRMSLLADIDVPALVVTGERDAFVPDDVARAMVDALPDADLRRIPRSGHSTPLEAPDALAQCLTGFWDSC